MLNISKKCRKGVRVLVKATDNQCFIYVLLLCIISQSCNIDSINGQYKVLRYNQANNITSLDPAFAKSQNNMWAINQLYDGLVSLNDSLEIIPRIAKSWEFSEDRKQITFNLNNTYSFHDDICFDGKSRLVTADDFVYSFNRIIDKETNSPGSWIFKGTVAEDNPFVAKNDSTFIINFQRPFLPIMGVLTMQYCSVVAQEAVEFYGNQFRANPVGTGPYIFKIWKENQGLYLLKNPDYPNNPGDIDGIKVSFVPDKNIAYYELLNNNLDLLSGIESSYASELLDKEGNLLPKHTDVFTLNNAPFLNTEYIGINMNLANASIMGNKNFRKALNFAINKKELLAGLKNNIGEAANSGFVPKGLPSFSPTKVKGYSFNLDSAMHYLKKSNYLNKSEVISVHTNNEYIDVITYVAKSWENIGIRVKIELMEPSILRQGMRNESIALFRASWIADYPDPESFLCMFYSKNPPPPNYTRFQNADFDRLYELALSETDESKRYELYWAMDRILVEEAPVIFLYYDETAVFLRKRIKGYRSNALNMLDARGIDIID